MSRITRLYPKDAAKDPDVVLERAKGEYEDYLILGWTKEGSFDPRSTLNMGRGDLLWLVEQFKHNLLSGRYDVYDVE